MVVKCEISGIKSWYSSGQVITGRINIFLDDRILIKAIFLKIEGYAEAEWNTNRKPTQKPKIVKGRDDFIASINYLVGSEDSTSILMTSGIYTYNFSCEIPENCPSSFNSIHGHIRYQIKVVLDSANKTEEILKQTTNIVKPRDLRPQSLLLKQPVDMEVFESKCCCEFWKTPLSLYVNLPQGGFIPGETISVYARLINDGNVPLKSIAISLNQVVTFTSKTPRKLTLTERYNLIQNLASLAGNALLHEFLERIPIPCVPPSSGKDCQTLQIDYEIEVLVEPNKGSRKVVARIPILIGTIPVDVGCSVEDFKEKEHNVEESSNQKAYGSSVISSCSMESLPSSTGFNKHTTEDILNRHSSASFKEASFMSSADLSKTEKNSLNKDTSGFKPKYLYYEIDENIEMTPTTMEITKEITIAST